MSLKILFADDSVTAQNMGRKILTEAGYDVVAVSNGAAAVKKIAEQKPDIIILDVYMPGYTGLEVCERVRGSIETLKTPVLLTVGKMEPYKPEEANRVRADGVIVKPFEASDLLAIVKKFEERISQAAAPSAQRSIPVDRFDDVLEHPEPSMPATVPQATVDVPDHMATSSAFSDLLTSDPSHSLGHFNANQSGAAREVAPRASANSAPIPDYELPVSWRKDTDPIAPSMMSPPASEVAAEPPPRPRQIPVYQDREEVRGGLEVVPTAAPAAAEVDVARDPQLQETDAEATRNTLVDAKEPGLLPTMQHEGTSGLASALEAGELAAQGSANAPTASQDDALPPGPRLVARTPSLDAADAKISESDFEARVAAAMAAYNQGTASRESGKTAAESVTNGSSAAAPANQPSTIKEPVATPSPANSVPPDARASVTDATPLGAIASFSAAAPAAAPSETEKVPAVTNADATAEHLEAAAAAAAGAESGSDHTTIAQAVHRVMERLKPELVEEIMKELKSKK